MGVSLLVATRKGAFVLKGDESRRDWKLEGPMFLGHIVNHLVLDPRDRRTMLAAARTGHLGPTVFRSTDLGATWKEATRPPAFPRSPEGESDDPRVGRAVDHVFWLTPGPAAEPAVWYAGTSPQALFRSEDGGDGWESVSGFNDHEMWAAWAGQPGDQTPDGSILHSILIDPRDADHLYVGLSGGGVFESVDGGADWSPLNAGCLADFGPDATGPDPYPEYGQDPHCVRLHPLEPDLLYQQNHCGIYRLERPDTTWVRIGDNMPKDVGDIGFPLVVHPRDPNTAWVFPMDGSDVWPRTAIGGRPAAYVTRDRGESWRRLVRGFPAEQAWFTVLRQAMSGDARDPVGLYFGTTCGEVWASADEGERWSPIARHLPRVFAVEAVELEA